MRIHKLIKDRILKEETVDSKYDFITEDENMKLLFDHMGYTKGEEEDFCQTVSDIIGHGIDGGFSGFIYYSELSKFFDENKERIMDYLVDMIGENELLEVISKKVDVRSVMECGDAAKSWYVWAFAEGVFFSHEEDIEEALK